MPDAHDHIVSSWVRSTFYGALLGAGAAGLGTSYFEPAVWIAQQQPGAGARVLADLALRGALLLVMTLVMGLITASADLLMLRFGRVSPPHGPVAWVAPITCGFGLATSNDLQHAGMRLAYFPRSTLELWAVGAIAFGLEVAVLRHLVFAFARKSLRARPEAGVPAALSGSPSRPL